MSVPTVPTIVSPADGASVSGVVSIQWTASTLLQGGFTWSDSDGGASDPPNAGFTWSDEPYAPGDAPTAGFTWSDS